MKRIKILSKKYDGSLRDEYETYLYEEKEDILTVFSPPGLVAWDYRKSAWIPSKDGLIEIYNKSKWFHVWHIAERINSSIRIYVHIALPAMWKEQLLEWIDLDLDFRVHLDDSIELKDQEEFERNIDRMQYPPQLVEQAREACREVKLGLENKTFPFDHEQQVELYYALKTNMNMVHK